MSSSQQSLQTFLDALASAAPAPGGGGASALSGALGAALVSMVANLTLAKDPEPERAEALIDTRQRAEALRARLSELIDEDARAYDAVIGAYHLPRSDAGERRVRRQAIEDALHLATQIPLETAACCLEVLELADVAARLGLRAAVTDAGAAAQLAEAGARAVLYNVDINLASIKDEAYAAAARARADSMIARLPDLLAQALASMHASLQPAKGA